MRDVAEGVVRVISYQSMEAIFPEHGQYFQVVVLHSLDNLQLEENLLVNLLRTNQEIINKQVNNITPEHQLSFPFRLPFDFA